MLVSLPTNLILCASMFHLPRTWRSSGGIPTSVCMARVGILLSNPYAAQIISFRAVCASVINLLFSHTWMPDVSCGMIRPLISLCVHHAFSPLVWYLFIIA